MHYVCVYTYIFIVDEHCVGMATHTGITGYRVSMRAHVHSETRLSDSVRSVVVVELVVCCII